MPISVQMRVASVIIVLVLGLQFFVNIARSDRSGWPFTDYPMYSQSHREGDRMTAVPVVFGITADGQEVGLSPDDLGMNDWQFMYWIRAIAPDYKKFSDSQAGKPALRSLRSWLKSTRLFAWLRNRRPEPISTASANEVGSQSTRAVSPAFINDGLATYQQKYGKRFVRLRVEDTGVVVTRNGAQKVPPLFVAEIAVPAETH